MIQGYTENLWLGAVSPKVVKLTTIWLVSLTSFDVKSD